MNGLDILQIIGICIAILLLILSSVIILRAKMGRGASLSKHAASSRTRFITLGLFLTIGGALFYSFIGWWLLPTYALPNWLFAILALSYLAQLGLAWIPEKVTGSKQSMWHLRFGAVVTISMLILLTTLSFNTSQLNTVSAIIVPIATGLFAALLVASIISKRMRRSLLLVEMTCIILFCISMIALALKL